LGLDLKFCVVCLCYENFDYYVFGFIFFGNGVKIV
jgi:hypothetical protein